jgi:hypothetical protein
MVGKSKYQVGRSSPPLKRDDDDPVFPQQGK